MSAPFDTMRPSHPLPPMDENTDDKQSAYHAHRIEYARQLAEDGLGRAYPTERHAVWPR